MNITESKYKSIVAQGWTMMFFVFLAMFVTDLTKSAITTDFSKWSTDPGLGGLSILIVIMGVYTFMPMLIQSYSGRWFRWLVVGVTVFFTLFFMAHQATHLLAGDKPFGIMHLLDIAHHILGVWVVVSASLWAKEGVQEKTKNFDERLSD
ncbi:MAG: hypothetical protein COB33_013520 [Thiotrichaceae bacterium]|nr:hypothetical protein [Thiotrichaceae bacterium]